MVPDGLLIWVLAVEGVLVGLVLAWLTASAGARSHRRRRTAARLSPARAALTRGFSGESLADSDLSAVARLPPKLRVDLLVTAGQSLRGIARERLAAIARDTGLTADAQRRCASRRWWRRLQGVRLLSLTGGGTLETAALMTDGDDEVRAAAATAAADQPRPDIDRLIAMLDDPAPLCRFAAKSSLVRIGRPVVGPLARRLKASSGGRIDEAMEVAAGVAEARLLPAALVLTHHGSARTRSLAASVAGAIGGAEAVAALDRLLTDEDGAVRAAAAAGLGKLAHWPSGPQLAAALGDPSWEVRRNSALALRALGPPGLVMLRDSLQDPDRFVRDMARQVLELPDTAFRAGIA